MPQTPSTLVSNTLDYFGYGPNQQQNVAFTKMDLGYNIVRGLLIPDFTVTSDSDRDEAFNRSVIFQFNPTEINYEKQTRWNSEQRLGYNAEIDFWTSGGPFICSFTLFMDYTPAALYRNLRHKGRTDFNAATNGTYINTFDVSNSGIGNETLGLLPELQKIESFQYPKTDKNSLVVFTNGFADTTQQKQFYQPPYLIFSYGSVAAVCALIGLTRKDILFNKSLNPIRTELGVTLKIIESRVVDTNLVLKPVQQRVSTLNDVK